MLWGSGLFLLPGEERQTFILFVVQPDRIICHADNLLSLPNFINFFTYLVTARGFQVPHRAFHVRVTQPLLDGPQIDSGP